MSRDIFSLPPPTHFKIKGDITEMIYNDLNKFYYYRKIRYLQEGIPRWIYAKSDVAMSVISVFRCVEYVFKLCVHEGRFWRIFDESETF